MTRWPDPYRVLFPLGLLHAGLAAAVWPLFAAGWIPYPATAHWTLMIQGFVFSFVLGFLLTAMSAFLHAGKAAWWEVAIASACMLIVGIAALAGWAAAAQVAFLASIGLVAQAALRRLPRRRGDPPEEFLFVALGFAFGAVAGVTALGAACGWWDEPQPRYALRMLTNGMMLSIVLGVGGLLVPTFSGMRQPLVVPGVARPHERGPRRRLYVTLGIILIAAIVLDTMGKSGPAAWLRAVPVTTMALLVWKLFRLPGRRDLLSWTLWTAGWFLVAGAWAVCFVPAHAVMANHLVFLGGFGLLIMGIATRVVVSHGGYPAVHERRVLRPASVILVGVALLTRVGAEFAPRSANLHYGLAGILWILAWAVWAFGAFGRLRSTGIQRPAPRGGLAVAVEGRFESS